MLNENCLAYAREEVIWKRSNNQEKDVLVTFLRNQNASSQLPIVEVGHDRRVRCVPRHLHRGMDSHVRREDDARGPSIPGPQRRYSQLQHALRGGLDSSSSEQFYSVPAAISHSSLHEIATTIFLVQCLSGTLFFLDPSSMLVLMIKNLARFCFATLLAQAFMFLPENGVLGT